MKRFIRALTVTAFVLGLAYSAQGGEDPFWYSGLVTGVGGTTTFEITAAEGRDTSEVLDARYWTDVSIQYRFTSGGDDSVDITIFFQHSLDQTNWYLIDSTASIVDSTYYYNAITLVPSRYFRLEVLGREGNQDASAVTGVITVYAKGTMPDGVGSANATTNFPW